MSYINIGFLSICLSVTFCIVCKQMNIAVQEGSLDYGYIIVTRIASYSRRN